MERSRAETVVLPCPTPKITFKKGHLTRIVSPWDLTVAPNHWWDLISTCFPLEMRSPGEKTNENDTQWSQYDNTLIPSAGPQVAFPFQALGNIWTVGREQALGLQLQYFSCKDDQGENLKRMVCATRPLFRRSGDSSPLSLAGYRLVWPSLTPLTLGSVWPPGD